MKYLMFSNRKETCQHDTFSVIFKLDWLRHGLFRPIKMVSLNAKLTELYNIYTERNWFQLVCPPRPCVQFCTQILCTQTCQFEWKTKVITSVRILC